MSGIYISDMEMPKSCFGCPLLDYADTFKCRIGFRSLTQEHGINISRPLNCPLVHVPDHGRLIDADALKVSLAFAEKTGEWVVPVLRAVMIVIDEMPTIISVDKKEGTR